MTQTILIVLVCSMSLIFLQILKYYIARCIILERKLKALTCQKDLPDLNIMPSKNTSPIKTARGNPIINAILPIPSDIVGKSVTNSVPIIRASLNKIKRLIILPNIIRIISRKQPNANKTILNVVYYSSFP